MSTTQFQSLAMTLPGGTRRGAIRQLAGVSLSGILAALGIERSSAAQGGGKSATKGDGKRPKSATRSEARKRRKAKLGPAGPQGPAGAQGSGGPQGATGAQGPTGPKLITAPLAIHEAECTIPNGGPAQCYATCGTGEIPVSGGYTTPPVSGIAVHQSARLNDNGWIIDVRNTSGGPATVYVEVYCVS